MSDTLTDHAVEAARANATAAAGDPAEGPKRRRLGGFIGSPLERFFISSVAVVGALVLWQLSYENEWVNRLFTSSPVEVWKAFRELVDNGELARHGYASLKLFLVGTGISVAIAIPLGILVGWYRRMNAALDPFVSILYATPRIALIPLVLVWLGIGFKSQVTIVVLSAVFPLLISTTAGVQAMDPQLLRVARSYMAKDRDIFRTLALPTAVPYITTGIRLALSQALIGVVVAEYFLGNLGIGALMTSAGLTLRTDVVFVGVFLTAGLALIFTSLLRRVERRLARWRPDE
jgi:ABC-type nitrate/sulfonate/bicarbonate transport system permease component